MTKQASVLFHRARTLLWVSVLAVPLANATNASAQIRAMPAYQGSQPELVPGAQEGLATEKPKLRHIYAASPTTLAIVVDAQAIPDEPMQKFTLQPRDEIVGASFNRVGPEERLVPRSRRVVRNQVTLGQLVGPDNNLHLAPVRRLYGEELDLAWAESVGSYALTSDDDAAYSRPLPPLQVFRKSRAHVEDWVVNQQGRSQLAHTARHELFLRLPSPLKSGARYRIRLSGNSQLGSELVFTFDEKRLRTEAIHVNQVGYHPKDMEKVATFGLLIGSGGDADLRGLKEFTLVNTKNGDVIFRGPVKLMQAAVKDKQVPLYPQKDPQPEAMPATYYTLDFSAFATPGEYVVSVPGLGCSFPFRIDDQVWIDATKVSAQGYLNERSGIELGPPHTDYVLPRSMHPADGFKVHLTDPAIFFDAKRFPANTSNPFHRIQASVLENTQHPDAWGGWHDAGDYDRSIGPQNHPRAVHAMLDLFESNPAFFEKLNLNIPESGNRIPDIIDEALWCMELFRRIQQADGGVPANVEQIEHPVEPSFLIAQITAISPPTPQTCILYAAAAAQMSLNLKAYDAPLAELYRQSAIRAMDWAEKNTHVPNIYQRADTMPIEEHKNLAGAWMYRLTGDEKYHALFKASLATLHPQKIDLSRNPNYGGPWGVAAYALMPEGLGEAGLKARCQEAILQFGTSLAEKTARWPFNQNPLPPDWDDRLGDPWIFVVAHRLTSDARYLRALTQTVQFSQGNNPTNASYTMGLGDRQVIAFHTNAHFTAQPIPAGLTPMGPLNRSTWKSDRAELSDRKSVV